METRFKVLVNVELADITHQIVINQVSDIVQNRNENNDENRKKCEKCSRRVEENFH